MVNVFCPSYIIITHIVSRFFFYFFIFILFLMSCLTIFYLCVRFSSHYISLHLYYVLMYLIVHPIMVNKTPMSYHLIFLALHLNNVSLGICHDKCVLPFLYNYYSYSFKVFFFFNFIFIFNELFDYILFVC